MITPAEQKILKTTSSLLNEATWFTSLDRITIPSTTAFPESSYRVVPYLLPATITAPQMSDSPSTADINGSGNDTSISDFVSIATQCSIDSAHEIARLAASWGSRISVAVLPQRSLGVTHALLLRLRECSAHVLRLVDWHLLIPSAAGVHLLYEDFPAHMGEGVAYPQLVARASGIFDDVSCDDVLARGLGTLYPVVANFEAKVCST
jgi:hypothetical protein